LTVAAPLAVGGTGHGDLPDVVDLRGHHGPLLRRRPVPVRLGPADAAGPRCRSHRRGGVPWGGVARRAFSPGSAPGRAGRFSIRSGANVPPSSWVALSSPPLKAALVSGNRLVGRNFLNQVSPARSFSAAKFAGCRA